MKLLAKDLSDGQSKAISNIDVAATGLLTTANVFSGLGLDLTTQSSRPANVGQGLWLNNSNVLRFYDGSSDYAVAHSATALGGDVSGTLGNVTVTDDMHGHSNTTLSGVPGAGIDTTALHSGDSTGGDLSGTYPTNIAVDKIGGTQVYQSMSSLTDGQVLTWDPTNGWQNETAPSGVTTLAGLSDTAISGGQAAGALLLWDGSNSWDDKAMSGDATIASGGAITVTGSTGNFACGGLLALNAYGGSSPSPSISGQMWNESPGGIQEELYYYDGTLGQHVRVVDANYSFVGDVTGTPGATVVGNDSHNHTSSTLTLGAISTLSDVNGSISPSSGDVLSWTGSQWDAVTPGGVAGNFVVLSSGSTAAQINTALSTYDIVYLATGSYNLVTTALTIPNGKELIGLGYIGQTQLIWSGSPGTRHILMQNAKLKNLYISLTGVAHTGIIVQGDTSSDRNFVEQVYVTASTAAAIYGFSGDFAGMRGWSVERLEGLNLTGTPSTVLTNPGPSIFEDFYIHSAPTAGMTLATITDAVFRDGIIDCASGTTDRGIQANGANTRLKFENILIHQPSILGLELASSGNDCVIRDVRVFGKSGDTDHGIVVTSHNNVAIDGCYAEYCNSQTYAGSGGLWLAGACTEVHISNFTSRLCSNTNNSGIYVSSTCRRVNISSFTSYQDYRGLWIDSAQYTVATGLNIYDSGNYGVYIWGHYNNVSNVRVYSSGNIPFYNGSGNYGAFSNIYAISCAAPITFSNVTNVVASNMGSYLSSSYGFNFSGCVVCTFTGLNARDNTNHGIYAVNMDWSTLADIQTYSNSQDGIYLQNCDFTVLGNVNSYDNASEGVYVTNCTKMKAGNIGAWDNTGRGIYVINNSSQSSWSDITGYGNGTNDLDFSNNPSGLCFQHGYAYGTEAVAHSNWGNNDGRGI